MEPKFDPSIPLLVYGNELEYSQKSGAGTLKHDVKLIYGTSQASAEELSFQLPANQETISSLFLQGKVSITLAAENNLDQQDKEAVFETGENRKIQADSILVKAFNSSPKVRRMEANGNCFFTFEPSSGNLTDIQADKLDFDLNRKGKIIKFNAVQNVIISERKDEKKRIIRGEFASIENKKKILSVKGINGSKTRISSEDYEVSAFEIKLFLSNNNLEAHGKVSVVLNPMERKKNTGALFAKNSPVFVTAEELKYSDKKQFFLFKKDIKAWQEKEMLLTQELSWHRETGAILCQGGVKVVFPFDPDNKSDKKSIEIRAGKMSFRPDLSRLFFEESSSLWMQNVMLNSASILVFLNRGKEGIQGIIAKGDVRIVQNRYQALGQQANFNLNKEKLTLTGSPTLIEKDKGRLEGDKLTFYISDGRIIIENKERERSVTIIKS